MNLFVSQPMAGLTDAQILKRREELIELVRKRNPEEEIIPIDSFTKSEEIVGRGRIAMLGDSISLMADADLVIFARGWQNSKGCIVENEVCKQYGIRRIFEELMNTAKEPEQKPTGQFWR